MGYKYRLYPNREQRMSLAQTFGCVRYAYNWALAARKEEKMTYIQSSSRFFEHRNDGSRPWLAEVSSTAQQQALRDLQLAFKNFFEKRNKFPTFKKKRARQSARFMGRAFSLKSGGLRLEKIPGHVCVRWSRGLPSDPSSVTITRDPAGRYFASFVVEVETRSLPPTTKEVGIDLGIEELYVTSDRYFSGNPRYFKRLQERLAFYQKRLSRAKKGSKNRDKARKRVAKVHAMIADCRGDWLHKHTTNLVRKYDRIAIENLNVLGMIRNKHLAKHIQDASWGAFRHMLEYKCSLYGRELVAVPPAYTSQTCPECGHIDRSNRESRSMFRCVRCGHNDHADVVGALNILAVGTTVTAFGGTVRPDLACEKRRVPVN